jgi:hypothetical protein
MQMLNAPKFYVGLDEVAEDDLGSFLGGRALNSFGELCAHARA